MRILFHMAGVVISICLFLLGNLMIRNRGKFAKSLTHVPGSNKRLCNFFLYTGGTFEVIASVGGLLETVSVVLLTSGAIIDAVLTM